MAAPDTIFPSSIDQPWILAFDETMRDQLATLPVEAVLVTLTDLVPVEALDLLISQWGLSGRGVDLSALTNDNKRILLRQAARLNATRGTIYALRFMFSVFGMPDIEVIEAAQLNIERYYDGTWYYSGVLPYGFEWHWAQYVIKIYVDSSTVTITEALLAAMEFVLFEYAPTRCHHLGFTLATDVEAEAVTITDNLTITVI